MIVWALEHLVFLNFTNNYEKTGKVLRFIPNKVTLRDSMLALFLLESSKWFKKNVFLMVVMFQRVLINVTIADTSIQINQKHHFRLAQIMKNPLIVIIVGIFFLGKVTHLKTPIRRRSISPCSLSN